jgi:hypothetical protein
VGHVDDRVQSRSQQIVLANVPSIFGGASFPPMHDGISTGALRKFPKPNCKLLRLQTSKAGSLTPRHHENRMSLNGFHARSRTTIGDGLGCEDQVGDFI